MVWSTVLRELGAICDPYDYDGGEDIAPSNYDPSKMDKVEKETIARVKLPLMRDHARKIPVPDISVAMEILTSYAGFMKHVAPDLEALKVNMGRATNYLFLPCMMMIAAWTLIAKNFDHEVICCLCMFFTVAKSNGLQRVIFDCRALNRASKTPPPVNLCKIPEIMKMAAKMGATHVISADARHMYFQIGLPEGVERFFGLLCGGFYFMSRVLAMGFSFSCYLSQAISWMIVLHVPPGGTKLGIDDAQFKGQHLPTQVWITNAKGKRVGFCVIFYDNIGIFLNNALLADQWAKRLLVNAEFFNLQLKEMYLMTPTHIVDKMNSASRPKKVGEEEGLPDVPTGITFLGLRINTAGALFRWKHCPKKLSKWLLVFGRLPTSIKDVARIVGILIWDRSIRLKHLADISDMIDVLRDVSRTIRTKSDWNRPLSSQPWSLTTLQEYAKPLRENPWSTYTEPRVTKTIFLASDATETSIGGVWLDNDGNVLDLCKKLNMQHTHIFVKEVLAIYLTVKWARSLIQYEGTVEFRIAVDNRAAGIAAMRCYSSNSDINQLLVRLWHFLDENNIVLTVVDIHTDLNVADDPSRGTPIDDERAKQTIAVLKGAEGRPERLKKSGHKQSDYTKLIQEIESTTLLDKDETLWSDIQTSRRKFRDETSDTQAFPLPMVPEMSEATKRPRDQE